MSGHVLRGLVEKGGKSLLRTKPLVPRNGCDEPKNWSLLLNGSITGGGGAGTMESL